MLFQHTIPREVDAYDFTTGGPYMAPPIPYGHYAKDYVDELHKCLGMCRPAGCTALMGGGGAGHGCSSQGWRTCGHGDAAAVTERGERTRSRPRSGMRRAGDAATAVRHGGHRLRAGLSALTLDRCADRPVTRRPGPSPAARSSLRLRSVDLRSVRLQGRAKHSHLSQMLNKIRCGSCGVGLRRCAARARRAFAATWLQSGCGSWSWQGTGCGLCGGKGCSHCLSGSKSRLARQARLVDRHVPQAQDLSGSWGRRPGPHHARLRSLYRDDPFAARFLQLSPHESQRSLSGDERNAADGPSDRPLMRWVNRGSTSDRG